MSDFAIRCAGVTRHFGPVVAVDDLTLDVGAGELMALLGPSGCGKTTLLRLIAGFERPERGSIEVGGQRVNGPGTFVAPEKRNAGMVFQDYALFPHMTVARNVGYGLGRRGREQRIAEVLELVGLGALGGRYPHELSGGQAQRVALARALAPRPAVILLDEPFSNLDTRLRQTVRSEVRGILREAAASALFVTHDQEEALSLADHVAVMWEGRILQVGRPMEVYREPGSRDLATFLGDANFVPGRAHEGRVETEVGCVGLAKGPGEGPVDVMFRPEGLRVRAAAGNGVVVGHEFFGHDQLLTVQLRSGTLVRVRTGPL
ncbi:MAG: ABC transporter ATP-binding protein, partial [Dehalococcoidia bacterium]